MSVTTACGFNWVTLWSNDQFRINDKLDFVLNVRDLISTYVYLGHLEGSCWVHIILLLLEVLLEIN